MAAPQPYDPALAAPSFDEKYDPNPQEVPDHSSSAQGGIPATSAAGRRKRHYAGQAYDFGAGANSALGGQQQGGGAYPGPSGPQVPPPQGYPGHAYGSGPGTPIGGAPGYGQPPPAVGGYQAPDQAYPVPGPAPPPPHPGIGGITQGMGNLAMGGQAQHQPPQMQNRPPMNQLYPTDLLNQPLNVSELSLPPPPIILPPNVSPPRCLSSSLFINGSSPALPPLKTPTAPQSTYVRHLMQYRRHTRC